MMSETASRTTLLVPSDIAAHRIFEAALSGESIPVPYRDEMERAFGEDFSQVRAYLGQGDALAAFGVDAATRGEDILFAFREPTREQVAHELAHVVQSRRAAAPAHGLNHPDDPAEREANQVAARAAAGHRVEINEAPAALIQCVWPTDLNAAEKNTLQGTAVPPSFDAAWSNPHWRPIYEKWAVVRHAQENPAFLAEAEEYRRTPTPLVAKRLYDTYINDNPPGRTPINIDDGTRQRVGQAIQALDQRGRGARVMAPNTLFDEAYGEIQGLLRLSYAGFVADARGAGGH